MQEEHPQIPHDNEHTDKTHCGHVAIIGRPNVGKSTLLNHLLGQKLSITSRKPQTTRHQILGIKTNANQQIIYVDTPGLHRSSARALNRYMNRAASGAVHDVDLILLVVDSLHWQEDDDWVLQKLQHTQAPVILVVNKIDKVPDKKQLIPHLQALSEKHGFAEIMPLIAKKTSDVLALEKIITNYLPEQPFIFPPDQLTDRSERFLATEIVREKLMRNLGQELPYDTAVEIEEYKQDGQMLRIAAVIYVEKDGQKAIVVGDGGQRLKQIGTQARIDMEKLFGRKVFLSLWVKVKGGWADDDRSLRSMGYV